MASFVLSAAFHLMPPPDKPEILSYETALSEPISLNSYLMEVGQQLNETDSSFFDLFVFFDEEEFIPFEEHSLKESDFISYPERSAMIVSLNFYLLLAQDAPKLLEMKKKNTEEYKRDVLQFQRGLLMFTDENLKTIHPEIVQFYWESLISLSEEALRSEQIIKFNFVAAIQWHLNEVKKQVQSIHSMNNTNEKNYRTDLLDHAYIKSKIEFRLKVAGITLMVFLMMILLLIMIKME